MNNLIDLIIYALWNLWFLAMCIPGGLLFAYLIIKYENRKEEENYEEEIF